jgi:hypothetical protein
MTSLYVSLLENKIEYTFVEIKFYYISAKNRYSKYLKDNITEYII